MDLSATLVAFTVLYQWFQRRGTVKALTVPRLQLEKIFLLWSLVILAGLLLNQQPETPVLKNFLEFRWIIEFYLLILALQIFSPEERHFKKLLPILGVASLFAVIEYFLKYNPLYQTWADRQNQMVEYRAGGLLMNPMPFAHSYGLFAVLMLGPIFYFSKSKWKQSWSWWTVCFLTLAAVLLSFTRGPWIGMVVASIFMGFLIDWKKGFKILAAVGLIGVFLFAAITPVRERILFSLNPEKTYDSQRLVLWKTHWQMFLENPVLGLGYGENSRRIREFYDRMGVPEGYIESHAHNQFLHFLAGTGLLGLSCFLIVIFIMFRIHYRGFRHLKDPFWKGLALGVIGAEVFFYVAGFTESNFSIAKNRYALILVWALGCWLWQKSQRVEKISS